jgi:hypothetical protein
MSLAGTFSVSFALLGIQTGSTGHHEVLLIKRLRELGSDDVNWTEPAQDMTQSLRLVKQFHNNREFGEYCYPLGCDRITGWYKQASQKITAFIATTVKTSNLNREFLYQLNNSNLFKDVSVIIIKTIKKLTEKVSYKYITVSNATFISCLIHILPYHDSFWLYMAIIRYM